MRLPAIAVSRWAINSDGDVYRLDGYVGIGTDTPSGLIGLGDEFTYITVNSDGEIVFNDAVSGSQTLSTLARVPSSIGELRDAIQTILKDLDGYASDSTVAEHYNQHSQALQDIISALDGYTNVNTDLEHYIQHSDAIQTILKDLDGYTSGGVTKEALTFSINYNDPTAVDVPSGMVFYRQSEITAFLAASGTSNFKHLKPTYDSLPANLRHVITFNLAAGFHSPRSTDTATAWAMNTKKLESGGEIVLQGASSSSYNAYSPALTSMVISSFQLGSGDPYITFSGTPFTGLSLDGYYAVISTGQVTPIHDNDSSTIRLLANLSPTPTAGVSTVTIARPSTVLINSIDSVNRTASTMFDIRTLNNIDIFPSNRITFNDIYFIPFRATNAFNFRQGRLTKTRCVMDRETVSSENGNSWNFTDSILGFFTGCVFLNGIGSAGADGLMSCTNTAATFAQCYLKGSEDAISIIQSAGKYFSLQSCVLSGVGSVSGSGSVTITDGAIIDMYTFGGAKVTEFRNGVSNVASIRLLNGGRIRDDVRPEALFKNNLAAAIKLDVRGVADCSAASTVSGNLGGLDDGGGNQDVGFDVIGPNAYLRLDTNSNVTGEVGDIRIGGIVINYSSATSDRPVVDLAGNYIYRT